jgi:hypothetical protein
VSWRRRCALLVGDDPVGQTSEHADPVPQGLSEQRQPRAAERHQRDAQPAQRGGPVSRRQRREGVPDQRTSSGALGAWL